MWRDDVKAGTLDGGWRRQRQVRTGRDVSAWLVHINGEAPWRLSHVHRLLRRVRGQMRCTLLADNVVVSTDDWTVGRAVDKYVAASDVRVIDCPL